MRVSVVTPSLNKSFKFQSDWPYNNSQVYLLNSILEDLLEDEDREFKTKDDGYYFASDVHYPNNKSLVRQKVYMDKNGNITKTEVVDKEDNVQIVMEFKKQEYNKKFDKDYFELNQLLKMNDKKESNNNSSINSNTNNNSSDNTASNEATNQSTNQTTTNDPNVTDKTESTATIDDVVYPMYLPSNTYLTNKEVIKTEDGQRLILTFGGDSSFILVEETINVSDDGMIIPVTGEFDFLSDVIGVIGSKSLTWHSNGIEYYMASESITTAELVEIARSISVLPVSK